MLYTQFPQMFTNEHRGKRALRANGHLGEKGPQVPCAHFPKCLQMSTGVNGTWSKWALGANIHLGK